MRSLLKILGFSCVVIVLAPLVQAAPKVGVLLKGRSPFWNSMEKGALDAGKKHGADVVVRAALAETDVSVQIQLLTAMSNQGFDAIVIAPANKDALAGPVAAAAAKGIKIVVLESPLSGNSSPVFVGTDHTKAGEAAGELLAQLVGNGDEIAFLNHSQTNSATSARERGAMAKFRELRPASAVRADIYASAESGAEAEKAQLLLTRYPGAKAVFASGTPGTLAMLKILQEQKTAGAVKLVGFGFNLSPDVATAIEQGRMHGWIAWQPRELGARGVEAALALLKGETLPEVLDTEFVVVTAGNLKTPRVQALLAQ